MKILIDMNLSMSWETFLIDSGFEAKHWFKIGKSNAPDSEIISYAIEHNFIIFTLDLDFGTILSFSKLKKPSVIQIRGHQIFPFNIGEKIIKVLNKFESELLSGCLLTVDHKKDRIRLLPLI